MKLAVVTVDSATASENVTRIGDETDTAFALLTGDVLDTVGAVVSAGPAVVNDHEKSLLRELPAASLADDVMVAVYSVLAVRLEDGEKVAVLPLRLTSPATEAPCAVETVKLSAVRLSADIDSENVAVIDPSNATFRVPFAGVTDATVGGV